MPTYGMGDAIREMRMRLGYTQEELSYGICTPGTLSRIENGREIISKQVFEALCGRIPGIHHVWISCDTKNEMQRSKLCKQTLMYLSMGKLTEAGKTMEAYHQLKDDKNPFCRQFELYTQAIYQAISKEREFEILPKLKKALTVTLPDYRKRLQAQKKAVVLTYDEVYILLNMGIAYAKKEETEKALQILYYLRNYMKNQELDIMESAKVYPMILGDLAWALERQRQFLEAVKQCSTGIEICRATGKYTLLPHLLCIKAWCLTASKDHVTAKKTRRQAQAVFDTIEEYRGYGSFQEFYKAREPIYVTF